MRLSLAGSTSAPNAESEWGDLEDAWDAGSFESAMLEPPSGDQRQRLVGDLIGRLFTGYADVALREAAKPSSISTPALPS